MADKEKQSKAAGDSASPPFPKPGEIPGLGIPGLPDIRSLLSKLTQKLVSPLIERGVELEPQTTYAGQVGTRIGRVWATLWGQGPDGLRILQCNRNGILQTTDRGISGYKTIYKTGTASAIAPVTLDLGRQVEALSISADWYNALFDWSDDGSTFYGPFYVRHSCGVSGVEYCADFIRLSCRYVRVTLRAAGSLLPVYVTGFYLGD